VDSPSERPGTSILVVLLSSQMAIATNRTGLISAFAAEPFMIHMMGPGSFGQKLNRRAR